jgi:hypothetical protein
VLVAHICNPSYSEGRDREDRGSKPAQTNSSRAPILKKKKKTHHKKRGCGVAQGIGPEFKPQYCNKKKKREREKNHKGSLLYSLPVSV